MIDLTDLLGVDRVKTTPYYPQANGVIERMHATLERKLRKAYAQGKDWVAQIPFALFALRQCLIETQDLAHMNFFMGEMYVLHLT